MQPYDPAEAIFEIDPTRTDLAMAFRDTPRGPHGEELRRVLHRMRSGPLQGKYVLLVRKPGAEWVLARLTGKRGEAPEVLADQVFHSLDAAEWAVFKLRWEALTGRTLNL